jgi:hypothetical protein
MGTVKSYHRVLCLYCNMAYDRKVPLDIESLPSSYR